MIIPKSRLTIQQIEFELYVGHYAAERQAKQKIWVNVELLFTTPPTACQTDQLDDTFCYQKLTDVLHRELSTQVFHLIEHLAYRIYQITKNMCGVDVLVNIEVIKKPQLTLPNAGTCFKYGDY